MREKPDRIVEPGATCWRLAHAERVAMLVDAAEYLPAMAAALRAARRSVLLLGWDFDARIPLAPEGEGEARPERLCDLLETVTSTHPDVTVNILVWDMTWLFAVQRRDRPQHAPRWLPKQRVRYRLDGNHPLGASHHQKVLVVDDMIAFCGSADFTRNRWDTRDHLATDRRRRTVDGSTYGPRHEVMMAVDGDAAAALGELVRERWFRATGERIAVPPPRSRVWPSELKPDFTDVEVGIARSEPSWRGRREVREVEALYLRAIAAAERWIYLENQYFTSPVIGRALARRLKEPGGPEIIVVCPANSGGRFDRLAMDHARNHLIRQLRSADRFGRFKAFAAIAGSSTPISIHSKVMIVDDRLVRVGSANLNNRSFAFDTECDLAMQAKAQDTRTAVRKLLLRLLSEHAGCSVEQLGAVLSKTGSMLAAIDALTNPAVRHLRPLADGKPSILDRVMGKLHLLDPFGFGDNWKPWLRVGRRCGLTNGLGETVDGHNMRG
ncbi:phospholipase D-like domain-containing protein [Chelativorans sp. AA-79]|uniref:phospholipase D-like domain-containing protein n=1 Tax=Chelativorans sp. AA-79 TaxID=3028735 RepID=UPI0023F97BAE|nr:phospholipase D-like domain-containing protein [Chelativorans sp. AA-79]WEX10720.1 phospholipase D-like domain-containing protein [Chelativorans sp. AA-79]